MCPQREPSSHRRLAAGERILTLSSTQEHELRGQGDTHLGPPPHVPAAEALTTGNAEMATGSMVSELFSTALCTRCDSCRTQKAGGQRA